MTHETSRDEEKALVVDPRMKKPPSNPAAAFGFLRRRDREGGLRELKQLAESAGASVLAGMTVNLAAADPSLFVGSGKAEEIASLARQTGAGLLIFGSNLTPVQQKNLEEASGLRIVDRTQLILDIFARRAKTNEGKLQVELAQLNYMLPRLAGKGAEMSRLGGGIGTRGPGEKKLETDRRRINKRIEKLSREIDRISTHRSLQRKGRKGLPIIALIGYTNAGKSTLLNSLTGASVPSGNRLFSTLDATARRIILPGNAPAVLIDTVGFIRDLPHHLVAAFKSTLEEVTAADMLLVVSDGSSPDCEEQDETVNETLAELGASGKPRLRALSKADLVTEEEKARMLNVFPEAVPVSARTGEGIDKLLEAMALKLTAERTAVTLRIPVSRGDLAAKVFRTGGVLSVRYLNKSIIMECLIEKKHLEFFGEYVSNDQDTRGGNHKAG